MEPTLSMIIPSIAPECPDPSIGCLLHPARHFSHPEDVLRDDTLDVQEKRAILASWASDACAVESMPALRKLPNAEEPVAFDAVMDALRQLDDIRSEVDGNCDRAPHRQRPKKLDA